MENQQNSIIVNTDAITKPTYQFTLRKARDSYYQCMFQDTPEVSICIQGFNRLEKTKKCVENVLKYTDDIDYELILVDSGSNDGTWEYFQEVDYKNKKLIRITKNMGLNFSFPTIIRTYTAPLLMVLPNDVYVAQNWLTNLLNCIRSDSTIGMVCPMATNSSNLQIPFEFITCTEHEFYEKAKQFNVSNPLKWQQRMRLIPLGGLYRREVLDLAGLPDIGFVHDCTEDDWCIRIRRAGYRLMLCGDTVVFHDHALDDRPHQEYLDSLKSALATYRSKHFDLDAWDDTNGTKPAALALFQKYECDSIAPKILGIDVGMGASLLHLTNMLREREILLCNTTAFTTHAKYYFDLQTVCTGDVFCDRIDFITEYFNQGQFDYIILEKPINLYTNPLKLLKNLLDMTTFGGKLLIKLRNVGDINSLLFAVGARQFSDKDMPVQISLQQLYQELERLHVSSYELGVEAYPMREDQQDLLKQVVESTGLSNQPDIVARNMQIQNYVIVIEK